MSTLTELPLQRIGEGLRDCFFKTGSAFNTKVFFKSSIALLPSALPAEEAKGEATNSDWELMQMQSSDFLEACSSESSQEPRTAPWLTTRHAETGPSISRIFDFRTRNCALPMMESPFLEAFEISESSMTHLEESMATSPEPAMTPWILLLIMVKDDLPEQTTPAL